MTETLIVNPLEDILGAVNVDVNSAISGQTQTGLEAYFRKEMLAEPQAGMFVEETQDAVDDLIETHCNRATSNALASTGGVSSAANAAAISPTAVIADKPVAVDDTHANHPRSLTQLPDANVPRLEFC